MPLLWGAEEKGRKWHSLIPSGSVFPNCIYADYIQHLPKKIISYFPYIGVSKCALNEIGTVYAKNPTIKRPFSWLAIDYNGKWVSQEETSQDR